MKNLLLTDFISLKKDLDAIPLDTESNIFCLYQEDFLIFLNTFLQGKFGASELEKIADFLESKDGVSFENEYIKESIHKIANVDIQGIGMYDLVKGIIEK